MQSPYRFSFHFRHVRSFLPPLSLVLLVAGGVLLAGCSDDANEPAANPYPTLLSPAQDAVIRDGSDLIIELTDLDASREKQIFYRFMGALYYNSVVDGENLRIVHDLSGVPFADYRIDIGVQKPDDTQEIFATRRFQYRSTNGVR